METFLQMVARDLYQKIGKDLGNTAVVFPNKRAGLFFSEYLAAEASQPIWAPAYVSISELFEKLSNLQKGDSIQLVCELYKVFVEETNSQETLDDFYFWGELLISDFDDLDKNLVDANKLLTNLQNLRQIMNDYAFLDQEQEEAIHQFFQNFSLEKRTELKEKFILLWDKLNDIYWHYRKRLQMQGIAYEGMMYRDVMEHLDVSNLPYKYYVFVGFNVLNKVELSLFRHLQKVGKAMFYWDYDVFYANVNKQSGNTNEAGEFILRNLKQFPNELPTMYFDRICSPKKIRFISAPTENAQARWLCEELSSFSKLGKETGIVLCNESLLLSVLHALPGNIQDVNVTMGFPLVQTLVYSFVHVLVELQTTGFDRYNGCYLYESVLGILRHPYVRRLTQEAEKLEHVLIEKNRFYPSSNELKRDAFLELVFTPVTGIYELCQYLQKMLQELAILFQRSEDKGSIDFGEQLYREALFKSYTLVNRLLRLIEDGDLVGLKMDMFKHLLDRLLLSVAIPFHGEPAIGVQIMGVLETRNLDFQNLFILSVNEGQLPKADNDTSFIPYNLRKAFGMTTVEHKNAVYAYYFYRLIQRAENITLLYNTSSEGLNRGEISRFLLQFLVDYPYDIECESLEAGQSPQIKRNICVQKTPEVMNYLYGFYDIRRNPDALFSPSALNTYLDCKLKFYYRYVAHLRPSDDVTEEIDSALFGTIFHRAAELVYVELTKRGKHIVKESLELLLKDERTLQGFVDMAFNEKFFHIDPEEKPIYNGTQLIHAKVITSYLKQLLKTDLQYAPFSMEAIEEKVWEIIEINTSVGKLSVRIGGTIDRLDCKGNILRIVDYKTGGNPKALENLESLFVPSDDRPTHIFQTFLYAAIMCRRQNLLQVAPSLLYIHRASATSYSPIIEMGAPRQRMPVSDFSIYEADFHRKLQALLQEIFDSDIPFEQNVDSGKCEYCEFRHLCKR